MNTLSAFYLEELANLILYVSSLNDVDDQYHLFKA